VIAAGKLGFRATAEQAIEFGVNMVAMERQMICESNALKNPGRKGRPDL
jgi:2,4-dienoyl-CoA reductase-like NADH-dependent reductase (Old Yellow Enzyme family)